MFVYAISLCLDKYLLIQCKHTLNKITIKLRKKYKAVKYRVTGSDILDRRVREGLSKYVQRLESSNGQNRSDI